MKHYEQIYNLVWIFLAIGICIQSTSIGLWGINGPEAGFSPFIAGVVMGTIGFHQFIRNWSRGLKKELPGKFWQSPIAARRALIIVMALCVMVALMPVLGFLLTSILMTTLLLQVSEIHKWGIVVGISMGSCFFVYLLFCYLLRVNLPKGFMGI